MSVGTELAFEGPTRLAELVRSKQVKPRELVELSLARIESLDSTLNAFRVVMAEQALAAADALPDLEGPLSGVPIAVKDDLPVAGQAMTKGSRSYGPPEPEDGEPIARLRAAGAIPIGITNVPELTIWPWTASEANGITRNPWDTTRTPGGSSGGSAAAVASAMVPAATGSDGGGSIRIPAACCGLVGMKPTRGRVPAATAAWLDLAVYGALARSVSDSALLLAVMSGERGACRGAASRDGCGSRSRARSRRTPRPPVGRPARRMGADRQAALRARARGGRARSGLPAGRRWSSPSRGLRGIYEDSLTVPDRSQLERLSRQMAAVGRVAVPARRRQRLLAKRQSTIARILELWDEVDVLLTPGLSRTAIPAEGGFGKRALVAFNLGGELHAVDAAVQPHRSAGDHDPGGNRLRRPAAQRAARRPPGGRGHAVRARRPDRDGAAVGRPAPARFLES